MSSEDKQKAIVYCEGAFNTPNGKTTHGLVRFTRRYDILAVVDSRYRGQDAGGVLDGKSRGIPILGSIEEATGMADAHGQGATHFIIGLTPDGGRLPPEAREDVKRALKFGWNVDSGLHDFLSEDAELNTIASKNGVVIRDVRKTPSREELHFFTGDIEKVSAFRIAVLGTDSAVGKRTTAWGIVEGFEEAGYRTEMIGTGQTSWLQGARYTVMLDSLINDFVTGEIEHAIVKAWDERNPDVIVVEGQGSLLNPAYPGGFEILAAARPDVIVLQHAPARREYDGFPGYPIHPLTRQVQALEIVSGKPVVAITVNHESIPREDIDTVCGVIERITGLPAVDTLIHGTRRLVDNLIQHSKT